MSANDAINSLYFPDSTSHASLSKLPTCFPDPPFRPKCFNGFPVLRGLPARKPVVNRRCQNDTLTQPLSYTLLKPSSPGTTQRNCN
ncbi:unnamed protein product [Protopolystoma xenopodis]|uniref:Uncharacterized protein n=1 Tax=Protopolystoma xenopodis TaxID=117903 RepID=A0A448WQ84_9PLAT|nr:unnamed protein product [Protopolystoma xenopodis]